MTWPQNAPSPSGHPASTRAHTPSGRTHLAPDPAHLNRLLALGEMATALAHELTQPITAVGGHLQNAVAAVRAGRTDPEFLLPMLDGAARAADWAGHVVRGIRTLAAPGVTPRTTADVNRLVREAAALAEPYLRLNDTCLTLDLAGSLPSPPVDAVQVIQVLLNLLLNACDAVRGVPEEDRRVTLRTACDGSAVRVSVIDTGRGVAPEVAGHLFEPFRTTKEGGLGMGLPLVRAIVEGHGGTTWADSGGPAGTAFHFTLPVGDPAT